MTLTKKNLIRLVADETSLTQKQIAGVVDSIVSNISQNLLEDGRVRLDGLGTFEKVHRKARKARNPQTGQEMKIKARNVVRFKSSKNLRDFIN